MPSSTIERPAAQTGPLSGAEIEEWNEEFVGLTPEERIETAHRRLGGSLVAASSFGPTAPVLLKPLSEAAPDTPIINVRTHHETLKTLRLVRWYEEELDLDVRTYDAPPLPLPRFGSPAFAEFQQQVKVEPFQHALDELRPRPQAYLTGRMRWQSPGRGELPFVERRGDVAAINPVADLSRQAVEAFFETTGWPRDENYFDPTKGPDQQAECGLNSVDYKLDKEAADA